MPYMYERLYVHYVFVNIFYCQTFLCSVIIRTWRIPLFLKLTSVRCVKLSSQEGQTSHIALTDVGKEQATYVIIRSD